ncbi:28S rRNA (cytosine-C(5))-methyltransferase-like [Anopheles stephensi]|uniref:28S rRNA (cytosine-C(5))-methyltransferase-like n=1 Tax=Anopheles stephensi TaxID=30069 RepID=UPI001658B9C4|nr:28S rRNA (cytosine-C(5))-methyltransferase-like [Anopheles stephensi]
MGWSVEEECRDEKPNISASQLLTPKSEAGTDKRREQRVKLPTNYRKACKYAQLAVEEKRDINALLDQDRHFRTGRSIVGRVLCNLPKIDAIYTKLELATKEPGLRPWLARVLISELLYGSGRLVGSALPVECVRKYAEQLRALKAEIEQNFTVEFAVPRFVRINTTQLSKADAKALLAKEQWFAVEEKFDSYREFLERVKTLGDKEYIEDFHFPDMLVFPNSAKQYWGKAVHLRDRFILQNKACLLPTYLLRPGKKSVVLDMCAAPGLKTTHLAALMKNKGRIYAVEHNVNRYALLTQMVGAYGVIKTLHSDCLKVSDEQVPGVEYILLDPSCSGSGMLQRQFEKDEVDQHRLYKLGGVQYKLLSHAMNAYPNARRIVYSTCSVHTIENEEVVQGVLRHNGHFRLLDARKELGREWLNVGSPNFPGIGERCLYARTEDDLTIGMFVAVFERCPEGVVNETYTAYERQKDSYERLALIQRKHPALQEINEEDWRPEAPFAGKRKVPNTERTEHVPVKTEPIAKKRRSSQTVEQDEEDDEEDVKPFVSVKQEKQEEEEEDVKPFVVVKQEEQDEEGEDVKPFVKKSKKKDKSKKSRKGVSQ